MTTLTNPPAAAHGITTEHRMLIARINDLALDISALDGWVVVTSYYGSVPEFDVSVTGGSFSHPTHGYRQDVYLPGPKTPEHMTSNSLDELTEAASYLEQLLEENS